MACVSIRPLPGKEGSFGPITEWRAKREWLATCNSRYDEESTILSYGYANNILPIPFVNTLGSNGLLLCWRVLPKQDRKSPLHWVVTAEYSSEYLSKKEKDEQQYTNPTDRPATIKWSTAKYNKPAVRDINGNLILNSAGQPFDPPAEKDCSRWTATISKNLEDVPSFILDYCDAINSDEFTIQGLNVLPGVAKIMTIEIGDEQSAQISDHEEITYYVFTYTVEFRSALVMVNGVRIPEGWTLYLLDQGYHQIDPNDSTKRIAIKDDSVPAKFTTKPWPLNGSGARLANPTASNAFALPQVIYNSKAFSVLPGINV